MARSSKGNLIGRAAREEILEEIEYGKDLYDKQRKILENKFLDALDLLKELDPHGWEQWYDAAPADTLKSMYPLILVRCRELLKVETPEQKEQRLKWRVYWNSLIDALEALDPYGWKQWFEFTWKEKDCRTKLEMLPYVLEKIEP